MAHTAFLLFRPTSYLDSKIVPATLLALFLSLMAFGAEGKGYKAGTIERWDMLNTGTKCSTSENIFIGITSSCDKSGVRVYHIFSDDGFDYTVQPDTWDPFKAASIGQQIKYRIDEKGWFWTPDPKHGTCPWPCAGEKRRQFKEAGAPNHEAKYFVNLVEKRKINAEAPLTNTDVIDMCHLGLSEAVIIQKINTSRPAFDLGIPALKAMKENGVSDSVVSAMMQRAAQ